MVNNTIRNNTISEIAARKDLNTLDKIKNAEIIKYKKRTPGHKKLLNLFNDLLDIILTDKTLESESQEDKNENQKVENKKEENEKVESRKEENEEVESRKEENEDEDDNKNMLVECIEEVQEKYSQGKDFNSFINEFDHARNKEDKEKVVKKLKDISSLVNHYAQWEDDFSEYIYKLFNIINAIDYFLDEHSQKWASDF